MATAVRDAVFALAHRQVRLLSTVRARPLVPGESPSDRVEPSESQRPGDLYQPNAMAIRVAKYLRSARGGESREEITKRVGGAGGCVYHIAEYPLGWLIIIIDGFSQ